MSTALHMKLTSNTYFEGFPQATAYVQAASNTNDGFKLLYRILGIIHPVLRASKGGIHRSIGAPSYIDINDDSIYTFITRYKNYLTYEMLSPEKRQYNKKEQAMFVVQALKTDDRFQPGLEYVTNTLLSHQRALQIISTTPFPLDLEIDDLGVTIDERSPAYTVGESKTQDTYTGAGTIRAMNGKPSYKFSNKKHARNEKTTCDLVCKACGTKGHCITVPNTICYNLAKIDLCTKFLTHDKNASMTKNNTYQYKKDQKEKANRTKVSNKMDTLIRKLEDNGNTESDISPLIHLAQAFTSANLSDSEYSDCDDQTLGSTQE